MDGGKPHGAKIFSLDSANLWVEALVSGEEGLPPTDTISFPAASIDYVRALGNKTSLIRLNSGLELAVSMPQDLLMERLRSPDGPVLDLKGLTRLEKRGLLLDSLRDEFKKEAEAEKCAALELII